MLRFLEDGTFTRVGGNQELQVNVRLIAATNRDIVEAIRGNQFREDLFHRLNVVQFTPPALRERGEDVITLAKHFLKFFSMTMNKTIDNFTDEATILLRTHHWPGNVRELRNAIERCVILETGEQIKPSSLPDFKVESRLGNSEPSRAKSDASLEEQLKETERDIILQKLSATDFNIETAAETLQLKPHDLRYRMHQLKLELDSD